MRERKLKIFTFPDKSPEYLQLQIDSYMKYMMGSDTEFIVINASNENENIINDICYKNNIMVIRYDGPRNVPFSRYYVEQLNWFRETHQKNSKDCFMIMHSDMFFINKIDWKNLIENKKLYFTPQYRDTPCHPITEGNFKYYYMWDGFLIFDNDYLNSNNLTDLIDWDYISGISDVGGKTENLLSKINPEECGHFEMWNYYNCTDGSVEFVLNGNINYSFSLENKSIREKIQMDNRSFPYESEESDYKRYLVDKILNLKGEFIDPYDFQDPVHVDLIQIYGGDIKETPILHFKSGSGYQNFHNPEYSSIKLEQIRKIIFRDEV